MIFNKLTERNLVKFSFSKLSFLITILLIIFTYKFERNEFYQKCETSSEFEFQSTNKCLCRVEFLG